VKDAKFTCPKCGYRLTKLLASVQALEGDNANLKRYLRTAREELDHLDHKGYVASSNRQTFHKPECKWARYILSSPNLIEFGSHREAERDGYKPCKTCCA
jgi:hypothetical protein